MRWRVRTGYPVAVIYWILAAPTPASILLGGLVASAGLLIRGAASGRLCVPQSGWDGGHPSGF